MVELLNFFRPNNAPRTVAPTDMAVCIWAPRGSLLHGLPVEARSRPGGGHPFQPGRHPLFIVVGLQAADEPRAGVGQAPVVQVHGVLGREQDAHPERPRLFQ